jgi:DNA-binding transcriptional ArsR family regulator
MKSSTYHYFFTNLANSLKINIILSLREKEKSVNELSSELKIEQSTVSHALSSLRCCNIVQVSQKGKNRFYKLNKQTIIPMLKIIDKHSSTFCKGNCSACINLK